MATKTWIGNVGMSGTATGPHIHQYVKDLRTGQYLRPEELQSPLLDVRVGPREVPLYIKDQQGKIVLNPASGATITSEFGARNAPTAGASTFHQGRDIALPYGTAVKYVGAGNYFPKTGVQGFGNLGTIITPDQKYEIGFGHMSSLGKENIPFPQLPAPAQGADEGTDWQAAYDRSQQRTRDILEAFMYGSKFGSSRGQKEETPQSFADQMKQQMMASLFNTGSALPMSIEDINNQVYSSVYG